MDKQSTALMVQLTLKLLLCLVLCAPLLHMTKPSRSRLPLQGA